LSEQSKERFSKTINLLDSLNIKFDLDETLVRGLDYYSEVVFEYHYIAPDGKTIGALGAGGHYSHLVEELGGPNLAGVGSLLASNGSPRLSPAKIYFLMPFRFWLSTSCPSARSISKKSMN
jgi:histidyl-tRNA synthetase